MSEAFKVKGSTINSKLAFVRDRFGAEGQSRLLARLSAVWPASILDSQWYPFSIYLHTLKELCDGFLGGEVERLREVGAFSAETLLSSTYKVFLSTDLLATLQRLVTLHKLFYSHGKTELIAGADGKSCQVLRSGDPVLALPDLWVAAGFYERAGQLCGQPSLTCRFEVEGERAARYLLRWS